jgi:hypothetical protein
LTNLHRYVYLAQFVPLRASVGGLVAGGHKALAAIVAIPAGLSLGNTLLIRRASKGLLDQVRIGGRFLKFRLLSRCNDSRIGLCLRRFCCRRCNRRLQAPEGPAVAGFACDCHPCCRRALEFPPVLQSVAQLVAFAFYYIAKVTLFVVPVGEDSEPLV